MRGAPALPHLLWIWGESNALWAGFVGPGQRVFAQVSSGFRVTLDHAISQRFWTCCVALVSRARHHGGMADVVVIEDEFSTLPAEERARLTDEWLASLRVGEPKALRVTGAELLADARAEMGW